MFPGFRKKSDIFIRENEAQTDDSFVQLYNTQEMYFYQVANNREILELENPSNYEFMSIYLSKDKQYEVNKRRVMTFADVLGNIGGIWEILFVTGLFLSYFFQNRIFVSDFIGSVYQIDKERDEQFKKKKKNKIFKDDSESVIRVPNGDDGPSGNQRLS